MKMNLSKVKVAPPAPIVSGLSENFGLSKTVATLVAFFIIALCALAVVWFVRSAPPRTITISAGKPGSTYERYAEQYKAKLAAHEVNLQIVGSEGSMQNLHRLRSSPSSVDIGFVQGGLTEGRNVDDLISLGSIAYQPLFIFYRSSTTFTLLSELAGKRIAVGAKGSGTRPLALALLKANGITGPPTTLLNLDADEAATALLAGKLDAIFLMGESAQLQTLKTLLHSPDIQLYSFTQADAYVRRKEFTYLNKLVLPEGSIDLGTDLPAHDVVLIGPTVELVARKDLNPAISDLLIGVAQDVHKPASILQKQGEFPAPLVHEFTISDDALRYYKSGQSFTYKYLDFRLASIINRIAVAFLPLVLVLVPAIRFFPNAYKFRIRLRFYHFYRQLIRLE
ncbi:MAG TPA: TAXI family TRAP transporter solute-binding subunit, partial [Opitutaceae bacterium]|nr:TAXI family TRAP transporter solute-binding subunit [Opitutaceae bacterium]